MKKIQRILASALVCASAVLIACSSNEGSRSSEEKQPIGNLSEKILGKWIHAETDGVPVLTNQKSVHTFVLEDSTIKAYNSLAMNDVGAWWEFRKQMDMAIDGNKVTVKGKYDNGKSVITEMTVTSVTEKEMLFDAKMTLFNDGEAYAVIGPRHEKYIQVEKDYSQEILGTWEGHILPATSLLMTIARCTVGNTRTMALISIWVSTKMANGRPMSIPRETTLLTETCSAHAGRMWAIPQNIANGGKSPLLRMV